ncbi:MAG: (d)CMP kinase [Candidatus Eisenbacteria sp.]|nr:(d)CMP kinase [Candidatus Eisenbacteria bacterium]
MSARRGHSAEALGAPPLHALPAEEELLYSWAQRGDEPSISSLVRELSSSQAEIRRLASVLALLAAPGQSLGKIVRLLWDREASVSVLAALALGWHGGQVVRDLLEGEKVRHDPAGQPESIWVLENMLTEPEPFDIDERKNSDIKASVGRSCGSLIALVGPSGSGKSTVGPAVAKELSVPFIDIDREIGKELGMAIYEIFRLQGEHVFRRREQEAIKRLSSKSSGVVAVGAGAVNTLASRIELMKFPRVLWFHVSQDVAQARLTSGDATNNAAAKFYLRYAEAAVHARMLSRYRYGLYAEVSDALVPTNDRSPEAVLRAALNVVT